MNLSGKETLRYRQARALAALLLLLAGCGDSPAHNAASQASLAAREACVAGATYREATCSRHCARLPAGEQEEECDAECGTTAGAVRALCKAPLNAFKPACGMPDCAGNVGACREGAAQRFANCVSVCLAEDLRCQAACEQARASDEESCGFIPTAVVNGDISVPALQTGRPADLSVLLDAAEIAVVEEADRRAESLRSRPLRLWTGQPDTPVRITQMDHDLRFGFPVDFREFEGLPDDLAFYGRIAREHATLMVAETSLKWRNSEPQAGELRFDLADAELTWADDNGFDIKAHVLLWGNAPPVASGSGTPEWLREKFPESVLSQQDADELRELIRKRVEAVVGHYGGRIDVWEVTNEMLNPLTSWFATRLGPTIVDDAFRWARQADPGAELVYNEWISEVFTGLPGPDAAAVRDRVTELLEAGVPIDALGQQGHFAPGLVNVGVDVDLSQRTRVDDYAKALNTLAETGLPIHITEVTFAAPEDPEKRAAQAEAIMRVWWGHESVEEIIFWSLWNKLGPRSHLTLGVFGDDGTLTRHGEAIVSLINGRWRTREETLTDARGVAELRATLGSYVAQWDTPGGPVHVRFHVGRGRRELDVVAVHSPTHRTP